MNAGRLFRHVQTESSESSLHSFMSRSVLAAVLVAASLWAAGADAFEIEKSETRYVNRRYQCELSVVLDAPPEKVEAILRDTSATRRSTRAFCRHACWSGRSRTW